jgi:hypothetical protein
MEERLWINADTKRGGFLGEQEGRGTRCTLVDNTVPLTLHSGANLGGGDQIRWNSIARG